DEQEKRLFEYNEKQEIEDLLSEIQAEKVVCLTSEGVVKNLLGFTREVDSNSKDVSWIIGGFSRGHFSENLKSLADDLISISEHRLAAHVVSARLCYSIELGHTRSEKAFTVPLDSKSSS
ncbi:MAG: hypothetical protein ACRDF4_10665, partial [Rhabdochlamydiaceae bacterium]